MRNLLLFFLLPTLLFSQSEKFTGSIIMEPQHYVSIGDWNGDGFNIGGAIEYQMVELNYFKAEVFVFPDLNGITFTSFQGVVGIHHRTRQDNIRYYTGFRSGIVYRQGPTPTLGFELGIEYYFNKFFIGLEPTYDYRTDGDVWGKDERNYWQYSARLKLGIVL